MWFVGVGGGVEMGLWLVVVMAVVVGGARVEPRG